MKKVKIYNLLFEADEKDLSLAYIGLEFTALSLGTYEAPFKKIITNLTESTKQMMEKIKDLDLNIDPSQISNPQEILSNLPSDEQFDTNEIFESIMAPLSFYREAIKQKAKKLEPTQVTCFLITATDFMILQKPILDGDLVIILKPKTLPNWKLIFITMEQKRTFMNPELRTGFCSNP